MLRKSLILLLFLFIGCQKPIEKPKIKFTPEHEKVLKIFINSRKEIGAEVEYRKLQKELSIDTNDVVIIWPDF